MSRNLHDLTSPFRELAERLLQTLNDDENGYEVRPFYTTRSCVEQAKLWRQSRSTETINDAIDMLIRKDAPWLSVKLEGVGPQYGPRITNALPGQSWHNYGMAMDCFVLDAEVAIWEEEHPGYKKYASEALHLQLTPGISFYDPVHVQLLSYEPSDVMDWEQIDKAMQRKWEWQS